MCTVSRYTLKTAGPSGEDLLANFFLPASKNSFIFEIHYSVLTITDFLNDYYNLKSIIPYYPYYRLVVPRLKDLSIKFLTQKHFSLLNTNFKHSLLWPRVLVLKDHP